MRAVLPLSLLLAACSAPPPAAAAAPRFDPLAFFAGRLHGDGRLKVLLSGAKTVTVESRGRSERGTLILDQRIVEGDKPPRDRQWRLREDSPGYWSGSLTDATGPVVASAEGNRLNIRFTMKNGMPVEQWLTLSPDGRVAQNRLTVKKLGVVVATLDETITKLD